MMLAKLTKIDKFSLKTFARMLLRFFLDHRSHLHGNKMSLTCKLFQFEMRSSTCQSCKNALVYYLKNIEKKLIYKLNEFERK